MALKNLVQGITKGAALPAIALGTLFSGVAVVANAATLKAISKLPGVVSDFSIEFTDSNNNGILDSGEVSLPLGAPDFSGMKFFLANFTQLDGIASIPDITEGFSSPTWSFSNLTADFDVESDNWNYEVTSDPVIPEPLTILGTGLVAGFLPLLKRLKQQ